MAEQGAATDPGNEEIETIFFGWVCSDVHKMGMSKFCL